jgi:hypothetical protein
MARSQKIALSGLGIDKGLHSCSKIEKWPGQGQMAGLKTGSETRTEFPEAYSQR